MSCKPPRTVFHGTDAGFDEFDTSNTLGAHFGTKKAAQDLLRNKGIQEIKFFPWQDDDDVWWALEENLHNRPRISHGPFEDEDAAITFCDLTPKLREPIAFEIDVYRPLELEDLGTWTFQIVTQHLERNFSDTFPDHDIEAWRRGWNESNEAGWRALHQSLTNAGFDCIAYRNETEDPGELSWIVWDHKKIHPNAREASAFMPVRDGACSEAAHRYVA